MEMPNLSESAKLQRREAFDNVSTVDTHNESVR